MRAFFDTSAFVKRYIEEPGSERVMEICSEAEHLVLSIICLPEMISTLNRLVREGKLSGEQYQQIKDLILDDFEDVEVCDITTEVIKQTIGCLEKNPLRAMDALHLGCALVVKPDLFVSSDRRQIEAAMHEGLIVEALE
ncbi:MAG TPA: type II toxin-antitoxin system VapC family toxin [Syntrophobacteraceae bacterium]|nr:type II toxin-antitoxin system VapC family toxin [Syntrophobacteraceae bacterium]